MYDSIPTIRYMGTKTKLLNYIIPCIDSVTPKNGTVCDIMAGSNAVSYALKRNYSVYTNDIQKYSEVISNALIINQDTVISSISAKEDLYDLYIFNLQEQEFDYFKKTYSGTYFSENQCCSIDSIRYSISKVQDKNKFNLYLLALMNTMCKVQSTPGHFAQFMPSTHKRIIPLQNMDVWDEFLKSCNYYSDFTFSNFNNHCFCGDYKKLLIDDSLKNVDTIYLDSPYSQEQYSRFYHILETIVKYDYPEVHFKAKYRDDRFMSDFCYKSKVLDEFKTILEYCNKTQKNLVISYSTNGVLPHKELFEVCKLFFKNCKLEEINYSHSTQGKGSNKIKEILITLSH